MPIPVPNSVLKSTVKAFAAAGCSTTRCAANLGLAKSTLDSRLKMARAAGIKVPEAQVAVAGKRQVDVGALQKEVDMLRKQIDDTAKAVPFQPVKIVKRSGKDDIIQAIMPDSHGAYADPLAMSLFLADMKILDPDEVILLGDHVDCGGFLAAHHVLGYVAQMSYTYADDIAACRSHLDILQANAPRAALSYIEGNHEQRVERWCIGEGLKDRADAEDMRRCFAPEFRLGLKERGIPYYRRAEKYDGLAIPGAIKRGKTLFVHDPGFSDPKRTLARFGMPVVHGHDHQSHALIAPTVGAGDVGVWAFGTLAVLQQLYNHSRPTTHTHGYGIRLQARSGHFLTISVPIIKGVSYLDRLFKKA